LGSLENSLRLFTQQEVLDGDNMYEAEGYGKQPAIKGGGNFTLETSGEDVKTTLETSGED
jgi:hypothetical protein